MNNLAAAATSGRPNTGAARKVTLPSGYYPAWGGQFENQQQAMKRLAVILPMVVGGLFTSTLATLLVLPTLYGWFDREETRSQP
jgi:Cu/Ag efflux pump CusA